MKNILYSILLTIFLHSPNLLASEECLQSSTAQEMQCFNQMVRLWSGASSYCLEKRLSSSTNISPTSLETYVRGGKADLFCPSGQIMYPPFNVDHGPTCPNGHKIENSKRVIEYLKGYKNYNDIISASKDESTTMRRCSLFSLSSYFKEHAEEVKNILMFNLSDNDPVVRALTIGALTTIDEPWVTDVLKTAIKDDDPYVQMLVTNKLKGLLAP